VTDRAAQLVEVLGPDVAVVALALRAAARRARLDHRPLGVRLERLLADFESAEQAWTRRPAAPSGPSLDVPSAGRAGSQRSLGVGEVAARAGVSERSVRRAAATGRLVGRLGPDGRWRFTQEAVDEWLASRRRSSA
jgi:Helix-turn-helix domain